MTAAPRPAGNVRLVALDLIRGLVMVLMAIDHVRVYAGIPAGGPTPGVFFTRWITHFCAPAFVFLAGTGAFLHGRKLGDPGALARFLLTRGLLLVVLELTLIKAAWTFGLDYSEFLLAGVIWMLGWCMVLLAAMVRLPVRAIGIIGLVLIFAQQLVGLLAGALPDAARAAWGWLFQVLYLGGEVRLGAEGPTLNILYSLVPWIGVMAAGYGFGTVMLREPAERRAICLRIGLAATGLFVAGAALQQLRANPGPDDLPALLAMLNQNKYPASQLFLLMTLGPTIALIPLAERARGWLADVLITFGRVPMFYYLLHIPVIHLAALGVGALRGVAIDPSWYATAPYTWMPEEFRWSLGLLYLVFVLVIVVLYFPSRWYARLKARRPRRWMQYL
jgi:uncharacterized membrane protein